MRKHSVILSLILLLSSGSMVFAASISQDLTITCAQNGPCDMAPNPGDTLFHETNILPGDTFNQRLQVINQDPEQACNLVVQVTDNSQTPNDFPTQLFTAIKKDTTTDIYGVHDTPTTADGTKTLANLYSDTLIDLTSVPANGSATYDWTVTFDPNSGNEYQYAETLFDFQTVFACNGETETSLQLTKTNDKTGIDTSPGDTVLYTLEVTAIDDVDNVIVTDLPPNGFIYQPGTWTSNSSVRGNLKPGTTSEPTYASPGDWQLGDMIAGEVVTLTYDAKINNDTHPGLYKDLAWAVGVDEGSNSVMANDTTGVFVGTQVNVVTNQQQGIAYNLEGQVLGAFTELPATGANLQWLLLAFAIGINGVLAILVGKKYA